MDDGVAQFSGEFSRRLKALRDEHNRDVWRRVTARGGGGSRAGQRLQALLSDGRYLSAIRSGAWRADGGAASRQGLYYRLIIRNHLKTDPELSRILQRANGLIGAFERGHGRDTHKNTLHCLLNDDDRKRRQDVWQRRERLEERLHPLVTACIDRRNRIARDLVYGNFTELWADICGLSGAQTDAILNAAASAIEPAYARLVEKWRGQGGSLAPWDMLYAVNRPLRSFDRLFSFRNLMPVYNDFTRRAGFDGRARRLAVHPLDMPYNALTFIERVPDRIHVLCNQTDGLRVWKILYHEFGHFLCARYNAQDDYAYQWEDSPCYHECMAQVFNLFAGNGRWLSRYFGTAGARIGEYDKQADIYRYGDWLANAKMERDIYRCPEGEGIGFLRVRQRVRNYTFPYHYFLNAPFHFMHMLLGEFFAKLIHREMQAGFAPSYPFAPEMAGFLIENFYAAGSAEDWKRKVGRVTAVSWDAAGLARQARQIFEEAGGTADAADDRVLV